MAASKRIDGNPAPRQSAAAKRAPAKPDVDPRLLDELGDLEKQIPWLKVKRYDAIRKGLRELHAGADPSKSILLEGERFTVLLGEKENETTVDIPAAFKLLGRAKFLKACKLTLTALKAAVAPDALIALCSTERTGSRSISIAEKGTE